MQPTLHKFPRALHLTLMVSALAAATADANASREQARREIDGQREAAMAQLKTDADKLGDLIVNRLLAAK